MKKSKMLHRIAAALLAGTMMIAMGTTAFADDVPDGNVTGDVYFTKTLDMSDAPGASVPDVTFFYEIKSGETVPASGTTPEILAGVGTPVVEDVDYTYTDTANSDKKVEKRVNVDFSKVTFDKPGIYRYVITEQDSENADITNDDNPTRYLDVYVENGTTENTYVINHSVLLSAPIIPNNSGIYESKSNGYTNKYTTYQLSLDKVVEGTMGDKGKEFEFEIKFTGPANASFTFGGKPVQLAADGTGSTTIKLADKSPAAVITGIPSTVKYTVKEIINVEEGYTTSYKINNGTTIDGTTTSEHTMGKANNAVVCTNTKNAVTPTGIMMNVAPYVLMVAVAAVLAVVFLRRKNNFEN
ncbi:MAG TPA: hypothetical protein DCR27_06750 [Lachnospiraceae bacterium]|nr:hypothetical protein [Lachnospiraceae bacterium]